jgi:hypothetical protein
MSRRAAILLLSAGSLLLAGCDSSRESAGREDDRRLDQSALPPLPDELREAERGVALPPRAPLPQGFRIRVAFEAGVRIGLPTEWFALRRHDAVFPGTIATLTRMNQELGPALGALAMIDSPLKLLGFDRRGTGRNRLLYVLVVPAGPGATFSQLTDEAKRQVRQQRGFRPPLRARRLLLPAGESLRLSYTRVSGGRRSAVVQYVVAAGEDVCVLIYSTALARRALDTKLFDLSARTLELTHRD